MNYKTIEDRTIFLGVMGSHAYGLNTPESDIDWGGICIPTIDYYFGTKKFEQANKFKDADGNKIDKTIYSIDKAISLMLDNNPNMLNYLFLPERCIKINQPEWNVFIENRDKFLSKNCRWTFCGYAHAQLERIQTHRDFLLHPVKKPNREDYGLPERSIFPETQVHNIAKISDQFIKNEFRDEFQREIDHVNDYYTNKVFQKFIEDKVILDLAIRQYKKGQTEYLRSFETISSDYLKDEFHEAAKNELRYITAYKNWKRYCEWKENRNPKRAVIEEKCGFDGKHGCTLIMLQNQAVEILETGKLNLDRTDIDKEFLMNIKLGNEKFDTILEVSKRNEEKIEKLYETSKLRHEPDRNFIEDLKIFTIQNYLWDNAQTGYRFDE